MRTSSLSHFRFRRISRKPMEDLIHIADTRHYGGVDMPFGGLCLFTYFLNHISETRWLILSANGGIHKASLMLVITKLLV